MKIISYNVNGIRAAVTKGFGTWLTTENPDVVCIQESKAKPSQIDSPYFEYLGYKSFWFSAQRAGYSGVGILCKNSPDNVIFGMNNEKFDHEGRVIRADFGEITVISVYIPSGSSGEERQDVKMEFLKEFQIYVNELKKNRQKLIIAGDFNICHHPIDIHDPVGNKDSSGFLPEERDWLTQFLQNGFIDSFRFFHSEESKRYSWWTYRFRAREKNLGWRIDYQMVTENLTDSLKNADILSQVFHSDHCPVSLEIQ